MSVKRSYTCDLCGRSYSEADQRLHGIWWAFRDFFVGKSTRDTEHHLCSACLQSAYDIWCGVIEASKTDCSHVEEII
jgi:hypothetical protein